MLHYRFCIWWRVTRNAQIKRNLLHYLTLEILHFYGSYITKNVILLGYDVNSLL